MDGTEWIVVNGFFPFAKLTATSSLQTGCLIRCGTETMPCYIAHWVSCFRLKQRTVCCFTIASIVGFFVFFHSNVFFFSFLSRIKTHFSTYLSWICHKHSHGDLGAHHFFHWAVLAQPDWPWFHSLRQTLSARSAPPKRPFVFVSLRVLKAVFVFFSRAQAESKVQKKLMHVKQPDTEQKLDGRKN